MCVSDGIYIVFASSPALTEVKVKFDDSKLKGDCKDHDTVSTDGAPITELTFTRDDGVHGGKCIKLEVKDTFDEQPVVLSKIQLYKNCLRVED